MLKKIYEHFEEATCVVLLVIMSLLAFVNVITRYFIQYSFAFTEEVEVACLVWLTMLGAAAGFRRKIHLGFDLLSIRFPNLGKNILLPLASILTIFTVSALIWFSVVQIRVEISLDTMTEALNIPHWLYTLAMPAGGILVILRVIEAAWKELMGGKG
ncbi:MAG TPA: TRAP transporter small permease [Syntrophorhabdaceae bacterium]|nr:TRAP transporter small permease [Syntrophorhabdaceae bacterium]HQM80830.1 TRAP transporter small permease [Syntrophorhabdaceae bacterium]